VVVSMEEMLGIAHGGQRTGIPLHRGGLGALCWGRFGADGVKKSVWCVR
jgi:hypothetical protein